MLSSVSRRSAPIARRHVSSLESVGAKSKTAESIFAQAEEQHSETVPVERREVVIREIAKEIKAGRTNPFFVVDLDSIVQQHRLWTSLLPRARPFYAVKCNPDARIVETLAALGAGFDCASPAEIQMALAAGARPGQDVIYANPVKHPAHIDVAHQLGVTTMTFDNVEELDKIAAIHPEARLVIRLKVDDSHSAVRLSRKFGASLDEVQALATAARRHGLAVDGIAFHVGSACGDASAYANAVRDASRAFEMLEAAGHSPSLLDVGGGFPCDKQTNLAAVAAAASATITFPEAAAALSEALDRYFPDPAVRVIGEPGRFYVGASHTLAVTVVGRRMVKESDEVEANKQMIYLSDGVYGAFNCIMFDGAKPQPALDLLDADVQEDLPVAPTEAMLPSNADQLLLCYGNAAPLADSMPTHPATGAAALPQDVLDGVALAPPVVGADSPVATIATLADASEGEVLAVSTSAAAQQVLGAASVASVASGAGAGATRRGKALASKRRMLLTSLWGPTCDSCDLLTAEMLLPELQVGDALVFEGMGAYTSASSSNFNGFPQADKVYVSPASH